jgi:hypothetical protein
MLLKFFQLAPRCSCEIVGNFLLGLIHQNPNVAMAVPGAAVRLLRVGVHT